MERMNETLSELHGQKEMVVHSIARPDYKKCNALEDEHESTLAVHMLSSHICKMNPAIDYTTNPRGARMDKSILQQAPFAGELDLHKPRRDQIDQCAKLQQDHDEWFCMPDATVDSCKNWAEAEMPAQAPPTTARTPTIPTAARGGPHLRSPPGASASSGSGDLWAVSVAPGPGHLNAIPGDQVQMRAEHGD
ncbi:unnamed protein product [Prorocentrum cordatum]|uniref:Uncharacterized protein n=1 Tax=Prorocentrum cordatum TaxID=2364126 RepID=A0ABN9VC39_9DINO|nr:unnamed protein product [Polarella glacialis]